MKLDPMIIEGKKPLTCFNTEMAKQFIGKECYFCDCPLAFEDLDKFTTLVKNVLFRVQDTEKPFVTDTIGCFRYAYCLPCEWVREQKESKWRPFTLDEFVKRFDLEVGTRVFLIRSKTTPVNQRRLLLTGIIQDKDPCVCGVYLGGCYFSFSDLFDMYDVRFGEKDWQPFGMEDKE